MSPRGRAHRGGGARSTEYCIPRPARGRAPAAPAPRLRPARAPRPLWTSRSRHTRALGDGFEENVTRERSRIRMLRAMRHGLHFSMQRERPRPHGHALHALIQEPRARRSTVAHAGEPSTYASSFNRTEPRRGAMGRASHQGLRASGNRPGTGHLPEDGLILPERLHQLLGVAVLLLRLPARLVDVAT